jgi:hypothetical protein
MKNTNDIKLELSEDFCVENIYSVRDNDPRYKKAVDELKNAIESVAEVKKDRIKIDDAAIRMETIACDITYKKGFHDGLRFILNAMSGGEVIVYE